jgi:hypothetical protein
MQFYKNMKNKPVLISIITIGLLIGGFALLNKSKTFTEPTAITVLAETDSITPSASMSVIPADKIEVVHFHGTQQCVSCIAVGKFAKQTIEDKFPEEVKSGRLVFKEINAELPENQAIVTKYQARGSSLFVNAIRSDTDNISEDTKVWQLVNNESQYIAYFEGKLKTLLGK